MRSLGLDLGTRTLGIAISDKTNLLVSPLKVVRFEDGKYSQVIDELLSIIDEYSVSSIALGLPKNMDNTLGFASKRSLEFRNLLQKYTDVPIILIDERLTTVEAENILLNVDMSRKKRKQVIDAVAATLILETYLKSERKNENDK